MQAQIEKALQRIQRSPFFLSPSYAIDFDIRRTLNNLQTYHAGAEDAALDLPGTVSIMTPEFQRSNNQWSRAQQIKFVENLMCGCRSTITLYAVTKGRGASVSACFILDGLQRLTAVTAFVMGDFPIFDDVYFHQIQTPVVFNNGRLSLQIYEFESLRKVVEFYIAMNEGITHSPDDIARARQFLATLPADM